jgi:hypothetical protein
VHDSVAPTYCLLISNRRSTAAKLAACGKVAATGETKVRLQQDRTEIAGLVGFFLGVVFFLASCWHTESMPRTPDRIEERNGGDIV